MSTRLDCCTPEPLGTGITDLASENDFRNWERLDERLIFSTPTIAVTPIADVRENIFTFTAGGAVTDAVTAAAPAIQAVMTFEDVPR